MIYKKLFPPSKKKKKKNQWKIHKTAVHNFIGVTIIFLKRNTRSEQYPITMLFAMVLSQ